MIKNIKSSKGFTLVEIMIVVAIIGLLAAITIPNFVQARTTSRANMCINNLRLIASAKDQAGIELGLAETVTPTTAQLSPYLRDVQLVNGLPKEPENGTYTIGALSVDPTCSVGGKHAL
jgi:prepilin-type N-terminal cleavage/methylation domain-containing protein